MSSRIEGLMFDVDGTLLLSDRTLGGYEVLPGAREVLTALHARGFPFVLLTNGSKYPPADQAAKLRKSGLPVADMQMITPSSVAAEYMSQHGIRRVLVLGCRGVGHALAEAGIETIYTGEPGAKEVDAVYVGWHPDCRMQDIETAAQAIWAGARLFSASDVPFFATRQGRAIGYSFAIVAAIRRLTRAPVTVMGKPSLHALRFVAKRLGIAMRHVGVVGDDPLVEIVMARRAGATALAVTTGITGKDEWLRLPQGRKPHRVLAELGDVLGCLRCV
ncbi:MAG TPA: HAD hydrolase-like protein [Steroidobacteraceae bacterium]